jgi:hypothetical protein
MKGVLMHNRKFGRQTNLTRPIRGHLRYYNEGYRVFEHSMADLSAFEINRCPKTFTSLNEKLPKDDQIENYFRAPNLSFTGFGSNCDRISDVFDLCKTFNIKKLVLRLGEARSTGENHIKIARDSVIAFMNKIGTECESFGVHIYWENSSSGFGSIENIIDILSNEKLEYREFFETKFNLDNFVAGKYTIQEVCEFATDIAFSVYDGNHEKILNLTKGKTTFISNINGNNFIKKLTWEEAYPRKLNIDKKAKKRLARNRLNKTP